MEAFRKEIEMSMGMFSIVVEIARCKNIQATMNYDCKSNRMRITSGDEKDLTRIASIFEKLT